MTTAELMAIAVLKGGTWSLPVHWPTCWLNPSTWTTSSCCRSRHSRWSLPTCVPCWLRAIRDGKSPSGVTPDISLADRFPVKIIMTKMQQLCDRRLIEYGVSLRTAWLTKNGQQLLAELEGRLPTTTVEWKHG